MLQAKQRSLVSIWFPCEVLRFRPFTYLIQKKETRTPWYTVSQRLLTTAEHHLESSWNRFRNDFHSWEYFWCVVLVVAVLVVVLVLVVVALVLLLVFVVAVVGLLCFLCENGVVLGLFLPWCSVLCSCLFCFVPSFKKTLRFW